MSTTVTWDDLGKRPSALAWFRDAALHAMADATATNDSRVLDYARRLKARIDALSAVTSTADDVQAAVDGYDAAIQLLAGRGWRVRAPDLVAAVPWWHGTVVPERQDPGGWPTSLETARRVLPAGNGMLDSAEAWAREYAAGYHPEELADRAAALDDDVQAAWRDRMGFLLAMVMRYVQGHAQANAAVNVQSGATTPPGGSVTNAPAPRSGGGGFLVLVGALGLAWWLSSD